MGFMTATRAPRATSARVRAEETSVLPTPVSVPVTNQPFAIDTPVMSGASLSSPDSGRRDSDFAGLRGGGGSAGAAPGGAVDDFVRGGEFAVLAEGFVGGKHTLQTRSTQECAGAAGGGVAGTYGLQVAHDGHGV